METLKSFIEILIGIDAATAIWANVLLLAFGMLLITKGGDYFTDSAVVIARATRVPPVIVGATIVSLATTFPEFMVSLIGALRGASDIAVGNALGSCCCNIGIIVGTCSILNGYLTLRRGADKESQALPVSRSTLKGPGGFMVVAMILFWVFCYFDSSGGKGEYAITRWQGAVLGVVLIGYLAYSLRMALQARYESELDPDEEDSEDEIREHLGKTLIIFILGAFLVIVGSRLMVANGEMLAIAMGVPQLIIGLTLFAVGTSLPEYTISLMAVIKGHGALGIGNIIGANVLNLGWVIASCALISPLDVQAQTLTLDAPVVLLLMVLLVLLPWKNQRITAKHGTILVIVYGCYLARMFTS